jgi:hypothetical protein
MMDAAPSVRPTTVARSDIRQLEHWRQAVERLADMELVAPAHLWAQLEHYVGVSLRAALAGAIDRLRATVAGLERLLRTSQAPEDALEWRRRLLLLRRAYFRTEAMVDFFADALVTRSNPRAAALLRACDHIATRSMAEALAPLGRQVPAAVTFLDKGAGAAVLRSGLILGDGLTPNPCAAIKVTRHALVRCCPILHEAGHCVGGITGWNDELASALDALPFSSAAASRIWSGWAAEIAADAFSLAHAGFAALVALRDVVDGDDTDVFALTSSHPLPFLRVLLCSAVLTRAYGAGPWDDLIGEWRALHPVAAAPSDVRDLIAASTPVLPAIAEVMLWAPLRAFDGRPLSRLIDPDRVSPRALEQLRVASGAALYTSPYWLWNEAIRLLALAGLDASRGVDEARVAMQQQQEWMLRLGVLRGAS